MKEKQVVEAEGGGEKERLKDGQEMAEIGAEVAARNAEGEAEEVEGRAGRRG